MFYAGIDIAKLNHFTSALSPDGKVLIEPFKFITNSDGFQMLVSKLDSFDKASIIIGLESTAHYGDNPVSGTTVLLKSGSHKKLSTPS